MRKASAIIIVILLFLLLGYHYILEYTSYTPECPIIKEMILKSRNKQRLLEYLNKHIRPIDQIKDITHKHNDAHLCMDDHCTREHVIHTKKFNQQQRKEFLNILEEIQMFWRKPESLIGGAIGSNKVMIDFKKNQNKTVYIEMFPEHYINTTYQQINYYSETTTQYRLYYQSTPSIEDYIERITQNEEYKKIPYEIESTKNIQTEKKQYSNLLKKINHTSKDLEKEEIVQKLSNMHNFTSMSGWIGNDTKIMVNKEKIMQLLSYENINRSLIPLDIKSSYRNYHKERIILYLKSDKYQNLSLAISLDYKPILQINIWKSRWNSGIEEIIVEEFFIKYENTAELYELSTEKK